MSLMLEEGNSETTVEERRDGTNGDDVGWVEGGERSDGLREDGDCKHNVGRGGGPYATESVD